MSNETTENDSERRKSGSSLRESGHEITEINSQNTGMVGHITEIVGERTEMVGYMTEILGERTEMVGHITVIVGESTEIGNILITSSRKSLSGNQQLQASVNCISCKELNRMASRLRFLSLSSTFARGALGRVLV
jgi:hypothetical protein